MNGFELLEQFTEIPFAIIFTTSYDQYAIKAIRFSALDYLLKPIDPNELMSCCKKSTGTTSPTYCRTIPDAAETITGIRATSLIKLRCPLLKDLN